MLEILVVDDETAVRFSVAQALSDAGHHVTEAEDGESALTQMTQRAFDVAIFDVRLPKLDGLTLFRRVRIESPATAVIIMTAFATISDAVAALRAGAYDYVTKPFEPEHLAKRVIQPIAEQHALRRALEQARMEATTRNVGAELIGQSPFVARLRTQVDLAAQSEVPLLIRGERGTGKRLVARTVHARGPRRDAPYIALRCVAIKESAFDAELRGYSRGAFAGATASYDGCFAAAAGGTLLLDEVGVMPMHAQAMLAAILREGIVTPLGSRELIEIDARVIATTHEDLAHRVKQGTFREDLLRKLSVFDISMLPLRARRSDIPLLFEYFLQRSTRNVPPQITPRAWAKLVSYAFPGNLDELADAVTHASTLAIAQGSPIDLEHLPASIRSEPTTEETPSAPSSPSRKQSGTQARAKTGEVPSPTSERNGARRPQ